MQWPAPRRAAFPDSPEPGLSPFDKLRAGSGENPGFAMLIPGYVQG